MAFLSEIEATLDRIWMKSNNHARFTEIFAILEQETKNIEGTIVSVFGIEVDTNFFTGLFFRNKLYKAFVLAAAMLNKQSMTLLEAETLTSFLFCYVKVVYLD